MSITGSFGKPFKQQVAAFRLRLGNLVPTEKWTDIWQEQHDRAFMVAGAQKAELLADLAAAVDKAIVQGTTLETFRKDFAEITARNGWTSYTGSTTAKGRAWRTRVIYKTNLSVSYAAGRYAQLVEGNFPFWVYRHGGSLDPREQHLAWDGLILPPDHPFWATHAPPNGWGCSCYIVGAQSRESARRVGGKPDLKLPDNWQALDPRTGAPVGIDKGWAYAPGASVVDDLAEVLTAKATTLPDQLALALTQALTERRAQAAERATMLLLQDIVGERAAAIYIVEAKRRVEPLLSVSDKAVIATYSGTPYEAINRAIRAVAGRKLSKQDPHFRLAMAIDVALAKLPAFEGMVYRGMQRLPQGFGGRFANLQEGEIVQFRAFSSASHDPDKAFAGPVLMRIKSLSGRRIAHLSMSRREDEVLLPRGLQFRFIRSTSDGLRTIIDLEEIAPGNWVKKPKELMGERLGSYAACALGH